MNPYHIVCTADGSHSVYSTYFDALYHSKHGAIQESMHVFIQAGLADVASRFSHIRVLEMGFGTGLNALLTCAYALKHSITIDYTAYETYLLPVSVTSQLNYPKITGVPEQLFMEMHQCEPGHTVSVMTYFSLLKWEKDLLEMPLQEQAFDVIYFDAFAPQVQPELWQNSILRKLFDCLCSGGVLVTYCAQGAFKRNLKEAGFKVEPLPGPKWKREITRARKS